MPDKRAPGGKGGLGEEVIEQLAPVIHERYLADQKGKKRPDDPVMQPWATLREDFKESGRDQARQIEAKLRRLGLACRPFAGKPARRYEFTSEQIEVLAVMEHERWVAERLANGWTPGPRDPDKKTTPFLVPWQELTEEVKELDRNPVRAIPELLELAGFEIVPAT